VPLRQVSAAVLLWLASTVSPLARSEDALLYRASTAKSFADVVFDLEFAIAQHNFRITGRNRIGAGLRERGHETFPDAEVIHFCNLERAREVLELDPAFLALMPCRLAVHEQNGQVVVTGILLPVDHPDERVNAFAREMNGMIRSIVDFAMEPYAVPIP
jgi:uncharacterized protein (DUF302 family)